MYRVETINAETNERCEIGYTHVQVAGHGSFGVVVQAELVEGGGKVAMKRTRQVSSLTG